MPHGIRERMCQFSCGVYSRCTACGAVARLQLMSFVQELKHTTSTTAQQSGDHPACRVTQQLNPNAHV